MRDRRRACHSRSAIITCDTSVQCANTANEGPEDGDSVYSSRNGEIAFVVRRVTGNWRMLHQTP